MKLRGKVSLCRTCGLVFTTTSTFDRHRVGKYGINRRCLTVAELLTAGFAMNDRGRWYRADRRNPLARAIQGEAIGTGPVREWLTDTSTAERQL